MRNHFQAWARSRWPAIALFVWLLLQAGHLQAGWKITQVDLLSVRAPYSIFGPELVAYTKDSDLTCLDPATGEKSSTTRDGALLLDTPLAIEGKQVWYRSCAPENPDQVHLCLYDANTHENRLLHTSRLAIALDPASADRGRLAVTIGSDIWLWSEAGIESLTSSAGEIDRDPHLSGNHLLWQKDGVVAVMNLTTRGVRLLSQPGIACRHLRTAGPHAVWVEERPNLLAYDRVMYHCLGSTEVLELGLVNKDSALPLFLEEDRLLLVAAGSAWALFEIDLDLMEIRILYISTLRLENPRLHGNRVFFLQYNCPEGSCMELNRYDLSTGVLTRVTSFGDFNFVGHYSVTENSVTMLHLLVLPPYEPDILRAVETPNLACGTAAVPGREPVPLNLLLLLLPALGIVLKKRGFHVPLQSRTRRGAGMLSME